MKKTAFLVLLLCGIAFSQQPYYNNVNLTLTGQNLYFELQTKISSHNTAFTYGDARDAFPFTDEDPANPNNVLLIYGYNDSDGNCTTDRSRDKDDFGGSTCDFNREHVFPRGLSNPSMGDANNGSTGIVADPHNIRPSDQQMNNDRASKRFQDGSGIAGNVGSGNWYPGDEWKGDVARMMMYMYTRYGDQCLPSLTGVGSLQGSTQMLQVFLQWNADDPVTVLEDQRNAYLETAYGNRNPFIDNPALATVIWGGPQAEDRWGTLGTIDYFTTSTFIYPNPAKNSEVYITSSVTVDRIVFYNVQGKAVLSLEDPETVNDRISIEEIPQGFYLVKITSEGNSLVKKLIVQ